MELVQIRESTSIEDKEVNDLNYQERENYFVSQGSREFIDFDQLSEIEDTSSQECPERDGLFPHPTDCHLFIQCANNIAYVMQCPATTFFNDAIKVCDHMTNAPDTCI
ncbi:Uncharacterized protein BM_BM628 [Brugia malayi]|uniref:Chitin-binding type-2 domain-containing protein n=1 Tax=Brugia malayi TaxID=6279 RepID=A0A4E9F9Q1_BRUMA|nr:Uncharacterized protein BM_BM628 [Brugia malayi]VIO90590.1 Uncharacterized protein BM_BM628 [Brugia malayi]